MFLSREQILAAQDRKFTEVDVPEWGGRVRIQSLDADQQLTHENLLKRNEGSARVNVLASLVAASVVDAEGNQMFKEKDMAALGKKNPRALLKVVEAIRTLNKDPDDDKPKPTEPEEEPANPSSASQPSDLPSVSA